MMPPDAAASPQLLPEGVSIGGAAQPGSARILTSAALEFVALLERRFGERRRELLAARTLRQERFDAGELPGFLPETGDVREGDWRVAPLPADLVDRRVEITGPLERKMVINALNSGARVFMADFEDSQCPTWQALVAGQVNLADAVRRTIDFTHPRTGKAYALGEETATLLVRPRGWHLEERHVTVHGRAVSASLFDFGLYFFHNAAELLAQGTGPYFYLPKLESHLEARLWNDVFLAAQEELGIAAGTIKATVLIETITGAFEMDEILFELREHSSGLNCGRWDYIFSFIKRFAERADFVLPDRGTVGMTSHFLRSYSRLLIETCHRRGVHAMGGMAAQIPIKNDPEANEQALGKVRADKLREVTDGHDGTWVAHPGLVAQATAIFDEHMPAPNQIDVAREPCGVTAQDLLRVEAGEITEAGLRQNVCVGVQYLEAWLGGNGCVPLYDLMEDAATAEISRTQIWQWIRHGARLADGRSVSAELVSEVLAEELSAVRASLGAERFDDGHFDDAARLFESLSTAAHCGEFLTLPAYERLLDLHG
ncbi:MAG: malate synthase A [Planctomycetota bacterium]|jgi:malate synthase|nr:malate synthase A [Planctomycetota bacterium]